MKIFRLTSILTLLATQVFAQSLDKGGASADIVVPDIPAPDIVAPLQSSRQSREFFAGLYKQGDAVMIHAADEMIGTCMQSATEVDAVYAPRAETICRTDILRAYKDRLQHYHAAIKQTVLGFVTEKEITEFLAARSRGQRAEDLATYGKLTSYEFKRQMSELSKNWMLQIYYNVALPNVMAELKSLGMTPTLQLSQ